MEITVRKSDLVKELQLVQGIVERKNSIPILSNVLAEARGGEVRIVRHRPRRLAALRLRGRGQDGGRDHPRRPRSSTRSSARSPRATCASRCCPTPGPPSSASGSASRWPGLPREDFPTLPEGKASKGVEIPAEVLRDLIARTAFAITAEDARYYLAGALLLLDKDGASMVATDGHRLVLRASQGAAEGDRAPARAGPAQGHPGAGAPAGDRGQRDLPAGGQPPGLQRGRARTLSSKMIEGQFPAFEKVIALTGDKKVDARARTAWPRRSAG